jgi:hypothetical protein
MGELLISHWEGSKKCIIRRISYSINPKLSGGCNNRKMTENYRELSG